MIKNSEILSKKLQILSENSGSLIFSIGDYYVQFFKTKAEKNIHFEAVSHYFLDIISKDLKKEFSDLSFSIDDGNYYKTVDIENAKSIVDDVQKIFKDIYKVNYDKKFDIKEDIDYVNNKESIVNSEITLQADKKQSINYTKGILIICGLVFIYYLFNKKDDTNTSLSNKSYSESYLQSSPETQLAIISDKAESPKQITISLFNELLASLSNKYLDRTKQEIANALVASYNIVIKDGGTDTLLELTTAFNAYSKKLDSKLNLSLEQSLTLFIKMYYNI